MGCGASKPADAPPGAAPLKAAAAAYKAGSPRAEPSSPAKVAKRLDVKPPDKPAAPTAAAKAQELTRSGTAGISDANRLQISAAGRRKTATSRRIAVSAEKNQDGAELSTYLPPVVEKDEADQAKIREGLLTNALFEQLEPPLLQQIVMAVERKEHGAGAVVIQQGDEGDSFYVVTEGQLDAFMEVQGDEPIQSYRPSDTFGELALLYNSARAATVKARTDCVVWALDRRSFRALVTAHNSTTKHGIVQRLSQIPMLKQELEQEHIHHEQIQALADAVAVVDYEDGEYIISMGEAADSLYIILSGEVACHQGTGAELMRIGSSDDANFFGESCLTDPAHAKRQANVVAVGPTRCACLQASSFTALLGSLPELISRNFNLKVLSKCELLSALDRQQLESLIGAMAEQTFAPGEEIIREGSIGTHFYIIKSGGVQVLKGELVVSELAKLDYFGERSLLSEEATAATVKVPEGGEACVVMTLDKRGFESQLGPLHALVERERRRQQEKAAAEASIVQWSDLQLHAVLGEGSFGRVKLVLHKPTKRTFALKCLRKGQLLKLQQMEHVVNEKRVMELCDHPFVLKLHGVFNGREQVFMLLEIAQGGELFTLLRSHGRFDEPPACLYAAMVASAFAYLHARRIAHRDLKPENLLFDTDGYLKLVDFGFAKVIRDRTFTLCGTPEYLAPEIISNKGHSVGADWWTLGILIYEMLVGHPPFAADNQMDIYHKIIRGKYKVPQHFPKSAKEVVAKLLCFNPAGRLGCLKNGPKDVLHHDFFKAIDWRRLEAKELRVPYVPQISDPLDTSNFDEFPSEDNSRWDKYNSPEFEGVWAKEFGEITGLAG